MSREPGQPYLIGAADFDASTLLERFPLQIQHAGKALLFELAGGRARRAQGTLRVSRYGSDALPAALAHRPLRYEGRSEPYAYTDAPSVCAWYVNFANAQLFCAYGAAAFAQDELQVAEHPLLGALCEALRGEPRAGLPPLTVERDRPTPILIQNVERWCAIDTEPELALPYGIYGRRFHTAKPAALRQAVTRLDGSTRTNLIAMEAPMGRGRYSQDQLRFILETAFVGFTAARCETPAQRPIALHTGHWGTGAYGGDRVLMVLAQLLAARLAGVDTLIYHSIDADGAAAFEAGVEHYQRSFAALETVAHALSELARLDFAWGAPDGN